MDGFGFFLYYQKHFPLFLKHFPCRNKLWPRQQDQCCTEISLVNISPIVCSSFARTASQLVRQFYRGLIKSCITTCIIVSHQTQDRLEIILDRNCVVSHHYHHDHHDHLHGHDGHRDGILILDGPLKIFGACNFRT